jgi:hypothetical protein
MDKLNRNEAKSSSLKESLLILVKRGEQLGVDCSQDDVGGRLVICYIQLCQYLMDLYIETDNEQAAVSLAINHIIKRFRFELIRHLFIYHHCLIFI